jgi:hypothetical protein
MQETDQLRAVLSQAVDETALVTGHFDPAVFQEGGDVVMETQTHYSLLVLSGAEAQPGDNCSIPAQSRRASAAQLISGVQAACVGGFTRVNNTP